MILLHGNVLTYNALMTSMFQVLRPISPLGIPSDGWLPPQNEDHNVALRLAGNAKLALVT